MNINLPLMLLASLTSLLMLSCQKDTGSGNAEPDPVDTTTIPPPTLTGLSLGDSYLKLNGTKWLGDLKAYYYLGNPHLFQIQARLVHSNFRSEIISILDIPNREGRFPAEYRIAGVNYDNGIPDPVFYITQDFDQPVGTYLTDTTRIDHFIEVLRCDTLNGIVEGRFELFMAKRPSMVLWNPPPPDYISLTEGKFHLKIKEP